VCDPRAEHRRNDRVREPDDRADTGMAGPLDEQDLVVGERRVSCPDPRAEVLDVLKHIQNDLFDVGADLCLPERQGAGSPSLRVTDEQITWLETKIDHFNGALAPLDTFVLPGGSAASAYLHHARTVTRRAERDIVRLASEEPVNPSVIRYVNRLSDILFVLARFLNGKGKQDVRWQPGLHR